MVVIVVAGGYMVVRWSCVGSPCTEFDLMDWRKVEQKMTNFERIKAMSAEEMAKEFSGNFGWSCDGCRFYGSCDALFVVECVARWRNWLESEADT